MPMCETKHWQRQTFFFFFLSGPFMRSCTQRIPCVCMRQKFWKVLRIVTLYTEYVRTLTFEIFCLTGASGSVWDAPFFFEFFVVFGRSIWQRVRCAWKLCCQFSRCLIGVHSSCLRTRQWKRHANDEKRPTKRPSIWQKETYSLLFILSEDAAMKVACQW